MKLKSLETVAPREDGKDINHPKDIQSLQLHNTDKMACLCVCVCVFNELERSIYYHGHHNIFFPCAPQKSV